MSNSPEQAGGIVIGGPIEGPDGKMHELGSAGYENAEDWHSKLQGLLKSGPQFFITSEEAYADGIKYADSEGNEISEEAYRALLSEWEQSPDGARYDLEIRASKLRGELSEVEAALGSIES